MNDEPWSIEPGLNKKLKREARERYEEAIASHDIRRKVSGAMLYALLHPLRREALRVLNAAKEPITPKQMSDIMPWDLPGVSFHVRVLDERNLARCTRTQRAGGATEHYYVSRVAKNDLLASILDGTKKDDMRLFEGLAT